MKQNQKLKAVRIATGLNQEDFAREVGVSASTIAKAEIELTPVTDNLIKKIIGKYGINDGFFHGTEDLKIGISVNASKESSGSPWRDEAYSFLKSQLERLQKDYDRILTAYLEVRNPGKRKTFERSAA